MGRTDTQKMGSEQQVMAPRCGCKEMAPTACSGKRAHAKVFWLSNGPYITPAVCNRLASPRCLTYQGRLCKAVQLAKPQVTRA